MTLKNIPLKGAEDGGGRTRWSEFGGWDCWRADGVGIVVSEAVEVRLYPTAVGAAEVAAGEAAVEGTEVFADVEAVFAEPEEIEGLPAMVEATQGVEPFVVDPGGGSEDEADADLAVVKVAEGDSAWYLTRGKENPLNQLLGAEGGTGGYDRGEVRMG